MHFADKTYPPASTTLLFCIGKGNAGGVAMCRGQNARTIYATKSTSNHFRAAHGKQSSFFYSFFLSHSAIYKKKNLVVRTLTWHPSRIDCNGWAMHTCDTYDATFICANPCSAHASGLQAFFTSIIFKLMPAIFFIWCGEGGWDP